MKIVCTADEFEKLVSEHLDAVRLVQEDGERMFFETTLYGIPLHIEEKKVVRDKELHARWVATPNRLSLNRGYQCSLCESDALYRREEDELMGLCYVSLQTPYCPYCGARMDDERKRHE